MSIIIRPTASLARRMGVKLSADESKSENVLGDWYANDIVLNRKQYILCVSENARLSVLLKAAPYATWPDRLAPELERLLRAIGVEESAIQREISSMSEKRIAKTDSRSVLGSIRDYSFNLEAFEMQGRLEDPFEASLWLSDIIALILPLKVPKDTVLSLMGAKGATILQFPSNPL